MQRNMFGSTRISNVFIAASVSFLGGVLTGSLWNFEKLWLYVAAAFGIVLFALARDRLRIAGFCLLVLIVGVFRINAELSTPNSFAGWLSEKQDFEAVIIEDIDMRTDRQLLTVRPSGFDQRILITTTKYGDYFYGDKIWVQGKVVEAKSFDDFDYRGYLERHSVYAVMRYPKVIVLKRNQGNEIQYVLLKVKAWVTDTISNRLAEPQASLLLGILIGAKKTLPQEVQDAFAATGTSHIVAVSGFNISIIVGALAFLARVVGRRLSFWISLFFIMAFVVMAGSGSSVIRAGLMGLLLLMSYNIGRLYAITPSICLAAAIMVFVNPRVLYWDIGFQLSFAATAGIVYAVPLLHALTKRLPEVFGLKTILLVTMAATCATLPFILLNFGRLSTVTLVVNMLVVPIIPFVMLFGAGTLLPFVGTGFAFLVNMMLRYILAVTEWFAGLPLASVEADISWVTFLVLCLGLIVSYVFLFAWVRKHRGNIEKLDIRY